VAERLPIPASVARPAGEGPRHTTRPAAPPKYEPTIVDLALGVPRPWPRAWHVVLSVAVFWVHVWYADSYFGRTAALCAGAEGVILVLALTRYIQLRPPRLYWLEYSLAIHYAQFGLPIVAEPAAVGAFPHHSVPRSDAFDVGALIALVSAVAMIAGFAAARTLASRVPSKPFFPRLDPETLARATRYYVPVAGAFVMLNVLVPAMNVVLLPVLGIIQQFFYHSQLLVVATAAYLARPRLSTLAQLLGAVFVIGSLFVITSGLSKLLVPLLGVLVLWWRARERLPILTLAIAVSVVIVVQPVKKYYRQIRWEERSDASVPDAWKEAFSRRAADSRTSFANREEEGTNAGVGRLSQLSETAHVIEVVPTKVPFGGGMIYPRIAAGLVPRVLWPEKPNMTEYALDAVVIDLGLLDPVESGHSVCGISLPAQGYYEHGVPGAIGWMALFGAALGLLSRIYPSNLAGVIAGTSAIANLGLAQEGGFYNVFGGMWQLVLGSTLLTWLLWAMGHRYRKRWASEATAA
jgi:hypothetical protein